MIKVVSVVTFAFILSAVVFGLLGPPQTAAVSRPEAIGSNCPLTKVALDEGYGVTRTAVRPVCHR